MLPEDLAMAVATFRFGVIADFVTGARLEYGERERLLREKCARTYDIPGSSKTTVWILEVIYKRGDDLSGRVEL